MKYRKTKPSTVTRQPRPFTLASNFWNQPVRFRDFSIKLPIKYIAARIERVTKKDITSLMLVNTCKSIAYTTSTPLSDIHTVAASNNTTPKILKISGAARISNRSTRNAAIAPRINVNPAQNIL